MKYTLDQEQAIIVHNVPKKYIGVLVETLTTNKVIDSIDASFSGMSDIILNIVLPVYEQLGEDTFFDESGGTGNLTAHPTGEHFKFMGVSMNLDVKEFCMELAKKGFKNDGALEDMGVHFMKGKFAKEDTSLTITFDPKNGNKVYNVSAKMQFYSKFELRDKKSDLLGMLRRKYPDMYIGDEGRTFVGNDGKIGIHLYVTPEAEERAEDEGYTYDDIIEDLNKEFDDDIDSDVYEGYDDEPVYVLTLLYIDLINEKIYEDRLSEENKASADEDYNEIYDDL